MGNETGHFTASSKLRDWTKLSLCICLLRDSPDKTNFGVSSSISASNDCNKKKKKKKDCNLNRCRIFHMDQDFTEVLPLEITLKILSFLRPQELTIFQSVCVHWRELGNCDQLWHHYCIENGWEKYDKNPDILNLEPMYACHYSISGNSPLFDLKIPECTRLSPICKWKHIFLRVCHLIQNWSKGRYCVAPILRGHTDKVKSIDCKEDWLISGSSDKTVKMWDLKTCQCERTVEGFFDAVTAVKIYGSSIIAGCGDGSVHFININNGQREFTLYGHRDSVNHLCIQGSVLISSGADASVAVWSLVTQELLRLMSVHTDEIECMSSFDKYVVTGSWDRTMILWDIVLGTCVHHYIGHSEVVSCCQFDTTKIVSGSADGDVRIWSCSTGLCLHVLSGHKGEVYCVAYNANCIVSGSSDSSIILWSHEGKQMHILKEHMGIVRCLHIHGDRLVSGGDQRMIVIWDLKSAKKLSVLHRHPNKLHLMWVGETKLITATPEKSGCMTVLSFW